MMHQRSHDVHVGIAMGDHHSLGSGSGSTGIVDGDQVRFIYGDGLEIRIMGLQCSFIFQPTLSGTLQGDKRFYRI